MCRGQSPWMRFQNFTKWISSSRSSAGRQEDLTRTLFRADSWAHHGAMSEIPVKMENEFNPTACGLVADVPVAAG